MCVLFRLTRNFCFLFDKRPHTTIKAINTFFEYSCSLVGRRTVINKHESSREIQLAGIHLWLSRLYTHTHSCTRSRIGKWLPFVLSRIYLQHLLLAATCGIFSALALETCLVQSNVIIPSALANVPPHQKQFEFMNLWNVAFSSKESQPAWSSFCAISFHFLVTFKCYSSHNLNFVPLKQNLSKIRGICKFSSGINVCILK